MKDKRFSKRYVTLKVSDISKFLSRDEQELLDDMMNKIADCRKQLQKPELEGIYIERDWPEYEAVANALYARITGTFCVDEGCPNHGTEHVCIDPKTGLPNGNAK